LKAREKRSGCAAAELDIATLVRVKLGFARMT